MASKFSLLWRLVFRDLRGGYRHFRLFFLATFIGVLSISAVAFLSDSLLGGLSKDAKRLLGGDVSIRLNQRQINEEERSWLEANGTVSRVATLRSMARSEGQQRLVEVKAVDSIYPLVGALKLENNEDLAALSDGEANGLFADPALKGLLEIEIGDSLNIGDSSFVVKGWIENEPDRGLAGFALGPRVMISIAALEPSGFERPGSLIKNHYRVLLNPEINDSDWIQQTNEKFPEAGWRIRSLGDATPEISETLERLTLFLTLIGLATLLICSVGSANAVQAYLARKLETQAIFKTLGAGQKMLFLCFFLQIVFVALLASLLAVVAGYGLSVVTAPPVSRMLNIEATAFEPFMVSALSLGFGVLSAIAFSFPSLSKVPLVPVSSLFRGSGEGRLTSSWFGIVGTVILFALLIILAVFSSFSPKFAAMFLAATVVAFCALWLLAKTIIFLLKRLSPSRHLPFRLAVSNLVRPGSPATATMITLGLGLTLLVLISQTDGNIRRQVDQDLPETTPAFFMMDIQKQDAESFRELVSAMEPVKDLQMVPLLRGAIRAVKSVPVEELKIPDSINWVFEDDRGLTWSREKTATMNVVRGGWWPSDYNGKPLVSLDEEVADLMGIEIGDGMTINVLGRDIEVEVANLRRIDWRSFGINFVMVFSPGLLERAPQTWLATMAAPEGSENQIERTIVEAFPSVTSIRVRDTLAQVSRILSTISNLLALASLVTLVAAVLVISGAILTSRQKRAEEMVLFKVLGATRSQTLKAFALEYGLLGLAAASLAAILGLAGSWYLVTDIMDGRFSMIYGSLILVLALGTLLTLTLGFLGTFYSLSVKASEYLRND